MHRFFYFMIALLTILLDQLSKWFVTEYLVRTVLEKPEPEPMDFTGWLIQAPEKLPYAEIAVLPFFNIVMVWNKGVSFGLFNEHSDWGPVLLTGLSLAITAVLVVWLLRSRSKFQSFALAIVIGGALGNVIDRLRFGAVVDFLDFHLAGWHWPAFNLADSCIVAGIGLLIFHSIFMEPKDEQNKRDKGEKTLHP